jgi:hypothetical protein
MSHYPQTAEAVAYALLQDIARSEHVALSAERVSGTPPDRTWILATYDECLRHTRAEIIKAQPTHGRSSF